MFSKLALFYQKTSNLNRMSVKVVELMYVPRQLSQLTTALAQNEFNRDLDWRMYRKFRYNKW